MIKLPREFYHRDTTVVAKDLLGKYLIHAHATVTQIGRIVEVEAYLGAHDLAAHSAKGLTQRTQVMFGPPGIAYVYLIYGKYCCMNVVTEQEGHGAAILLRAVEPVEGIVDRTNGPGLLCRAMHIDRQCNRKDVTGDELYLAEPAEPGPCFTIVARPRIGVGYAGAQWANKLLRFYIQGNLFVSKK